MCVGRKRGLQAGVMISLMLLVGAGIEFFGVLIRELKKKRGKGLN